jgi:hypothetical protein
MKVPMLAMAGIGGIEGIQHIPTPPTATFEYIKLGIQVFLGFLAYLKMRKESQIEKPKEVISNQNQQF